MRLRPRSLAAAAVMLSAALVLGACGSDAEPEGAASSSDGSATPSAGSASDPSSGPAGESATSSSAPSQKPSAQAPPAAGSAVTPTAFADKLSTALVDGRTAALEMEVSGEHASRSTGFADFGAKPPAISLTTSVESLAGQKSKVVLVDGVMYMQMGVGGSDKYAKVDLEKAAPGADFSQFDPQAAFKQFAQGFSEVTYVGEEKVDGEQMQHYRAVVDATKAKKAGASSGAVGYDAWFDEKGHIRTIVVEIGKDVVSTMKYSDWGKKVSIKAPPADQVVDLPSMPQAPPVSE